MAYVKCSHCGKYTSNLAPCCVFCENEFAPAPAPVSAPAPMEHTTSAKPFGNFILCPHCSAPVKKSAFFCKFCGYTLDGSGALRGVSAFLP